MSKQQSPSTVPFKLQYNLHLRLSIFVYVVRFLASKHTDCHFAY